MYLYTFYGCARTPARISLPIVMPKKVMMAQEVFYLDVHWQHSHWYMTWGYFTLDKTELEVTCYHGIPGNALHSRSPRLSLLIHSGQKQCRRQSWTGRGCCSRLGCTSHPDSPKHRKAWSHLVLKIGDPQNHPLNSVF